MRRRLALIAGLSLVAALGVASRRVRARERGRRLPGTRVRRRPRARRARRRAERAARRHRGDAARQRLLAARAGRRDLQLRRRALLRLDRQHAPEPAGGRHRGDAERQRLLARRLRRRHLHLRAGAVLRLDRRDAPELADRRHGLDTQRPRLLVGRGRRRHLHVRRRALLRLGGRLLPRRAGRRHHDDAQRARLLDGDRERPRACTSATRAAVPGVRVTGADRGARAHRERRGPVARREQRRGVHVGRGARTWRRDRRARAGRGHRARRAHGYWVALGPSGPPLPPNSGTGRRIVYSNAQQRIWLVEANGLVSHTYLVSGRHGLPSVGVHQVYSKVPSSPSGDLTLPWTLRFAVSSSGNPIDIHGIPLRPDGSPIEADSQLGTPLSHGCLRMNAVRRQVRVGLVVGRDDRRRDRPRVSPIESATPCARPRRRGR